MRQEAETYRSNLRAADWRRWARPSGAGNGKKARRRGKRCLAGWQDLSHRQQTRLSELEDKKSLNKDSSQDFSRPDYRHGVLMLHEEASCQLDDPGRQYLARIERPACAVR